MKKLLLFALVFSFHFAHGQWEQVGPDIVGPVADDLFGYSVALSASGDFMAVTTRGSVPGASTGFVQAYDFDGTNWSTAGSVIFDPSETLGQGIRLALSADGTTMALGFPSFNSSLGLVRVFQFDGSDWTQLGTDILGAGDTRSLGTSIAMSSTGLRFVAGAQFSILPGAGSGELLVYDFNGSDWALVGTPILNDQGSDTFGAWVDISGDGNLIAAASQGLGSTAGFVQVYENIAGDWERKGQTLTGESINDRYGENVNLSNDGSYLVFGSPGHDPTGGFIETYEFDTDMWVLFGDQLIAEGDFGSFYGRRNVLNESATVLAVTEFAAPDGQGKIYFYDRNETGWVQRAQILEGSVSLDYFGWSLALNSSGGTLVMGALGGTDQSGLVRTYRDAALSVSEQQTIETTVYPNPATASITINLGDQNTFDSLQLTNQLGQQVLSKQLNAVSNYSLDVSGLGNGLYYLTLETDQGNITKKVIKN